MARCSDHVPLRGAKTGVVLGVVTGPSLLLWALLVGSSGLRVETSTPDALCPDLGQVRAAARARLGDIEADGDWNASYALIHRPDGAEAGDIVRLELHDPAGRLRLRTRAPARRRIVRVAGAGVGGDPGCLLSPSDRYGRA